MKTSNWTKEQNSLKRVLKFNSFPEAISFMVLVSFEAEKRHHHPEWKNIYDKVFIELTTHDSKSLSKKDYQLAEIIDKIYISFTLSP